MVWTHLVVSPRLSLRMSSSITKTAQGTSFLSSLIYLQTWLRSKPLINPRFDFAFEDPKVVSNIPVSSTCVVRAPKEKPLYEDEGKKSKCPYNSGKNQEVYRSYTPVTARGSVGILSFIIKKQRQNDEHPGKMSHYIHSMEVPLQVISSHSNTEKVLSRLEIHLKSWATLSVLLQWSLGKASTVTSTHFSRLLMWISRK